MTNHTELRRLAEAATPGPWDVYGAVVWSPDARSVIAGASATEPTSGFVEYERPKWSAINQPARNAAYIAAMHPGTTLALLDRLARAEMLVADARRFRWLAEKSIPFFNGFQLHLESEELDIRAAIDAAMKEDSNA